MFLKIKLLKFWYNFSLFGIALETFLLQFPKLEVSRLENLERLEQLRILENGYSIQVTETNQNSIGVDRPEDLSEVEKIMSNKK